MTAPSNHAHDRQIVRQQRKEAKRQQRWQRQQERRRLRALERPELTCNAARTAIEEQAVILERRP